MAQETLSTLREAELRGDMIVLGCDDGQSRSAAIAAAWTRIRGYDDLDYWLDPRKYYPNALVYARMLEAAGFGHVEERSVLRKMMKKVVMAGTVQSSKAESETRGSFPSPLRYTSATPSSWQPFPKEDQPSRC